MVWQHQNLKAFKNGRSFRSSGNCRLSQFDTILSFSSSSFSYIHIYYTETLQVNPESIIIFCRHRLHETILHLKHSHSHYLSLSPYYRATIYTP